MDIIDRAHLLDAAGFSPPIYRYLPSAAVSELIRRFWVPVWSLPSGAGSTQRVLQYPSTQVVIADSYARFYGVVGGLSTVALSESGWAVGAMLQPGAGFLVLGRSIAEVSDTYVELDPLLPDLTERIRMIMDPDPHAEAAHATAIAAVEQAVGARGPLDDEGRLVNEVAAWVEGNDEVSQVAEICERYGVSERSLQRLTRRRIGLSPKWLIQRRRLHRASEELRAEPSGLADLAARLGYADQAHFTRDFRRVTAMTPRDFADQAASFSPR